MEYFFNLFGFHSKDFGIGLYLKLRTCFSFDFEHLNLDLFRELNPLPCLTCRFSLVIPCVLTLKELIILY